METEALEARESPKRLSVSLLEREKVIQIGMRGHRSLRMAKAPICITPGRDQVWEPGVWFFGHLVGKESSRDEEGAKIVCRPWRPLVG